MGSIEYRFRRASKKDQGLIRQLIFRARLNPLGIGWKGFDIVEAGDGQVLGIGQIKVHRDGSEELASLYIDPAFRNQGIAAALVGYLKERARTELWLTCRSSLIPFYERLAFLEVTDPVHMPAYFRTVWRIFKLFKPWVGRKDTLAVMHWDGMRGKA